MLWNADVWSEMERLRGEMDDLLAGYGRGQAATYPLVNVFDNAESIVVTAELPGLLKDNVTITYSDGTLAVAGKREEGAALKNMTPVRRERSTGAFEKTLRIPVKIVAEKIGASFADGVLTITMPKAEEAKPKTITIEAK